MRIQTRLAQAGSRSDDQANAVSVPIYQVATFRHVALGVNKGHDYSRSSNPTRQVLEEAIADLEGGCRGFAFASGMAALASVLLLFAPGDHLILSNDLYGGTYRLLEQILKPMGLQTSFVDSSNLNQVSQAIKENTKAFLIETPTNPMMKITDLVGLTTLAKIKGLLTIVDNTFMSPYLQRPLDLGADIVVHSGTKYLGGHNDLVAGLAVVKEPALGERIAFLQNAVGAILGPQDCWLLLRGLKTLSVRLDRQQSNAQVLAQWLQAQPQVEKVYYPGLPDHPDHQLHLSQADGPGAMVSFTLQDPLAVEQVLNRIKLIIFAESLGGVESLITYPAQMTHTDIPLELREAVGVNDRLLRLSVGIENIEDLIRDLAQALT